MKAKKIIGLVLVSLIVMSSVVGTVSAVTLQQTCPQCGSVLWHVVIRESCNSVIVEDCLSCEYINNINMPDNHLNENADNKCDRCGKFLEDTETTPEPPETPETPNESVEPDEPDRTDSKEYCSCNCHKDGISGLFWKIINFFARLLSIKSMQICACGEYHF